MSTPQKVISASELARTAGVPVSRLLRQIENGCITADFNSGRGEILFHENRAPEIIATLTAQGPLTKQLCAIADNVARQAFYVKHKRELFVERAEAQHPEAIVLNRKSK